MVGGDSNSTASQTLRDKGRQIGSCTLVHLECGGIDMQPKARPRIGLLPTRHNYRWDQFPWLKGLGLDMYGRLREMLDRYADVIAPDLVDNPQGHRRQVDRLLGHL